MEIRQYKVFKFHELKEDQQQKVLDRYYDINVDYEWWDSVYDDALNIGLKITGFDIDRGAHATGEVLTSVPEMIESILENPGEDCDTFKTAVQYKPLILNDDLDKDSEDYDEQEEKRSLLEDQFLYDILEDYRVMLQKEYKYLTTRKAIIETLEANEYDFTEDGKID